MKEKNNWLESLYSHVDSNLAISRDGYTGTHQWIISLTIGGLTAALAFSDDKFVYPTEYSFIIVLLLIPLVLRFFVRSCLEYTVFYRWLTLRNKLDEYFFKLNKGKKTKKDEDELNRVIQICLIDTNSVRTFPKMVFDNLRMAFLWPLLILFGLTFVGFQSQPLTLSIKIVLIPVTAMIIYEIYSFISYYRFRYTKV